MHFFPGHVAQLFSLCIGSMQIIASEKVISTPQVVIGQLCISTAEGEVCSDHDNVTTSDPTYSEITNFEKDQAFTIKSNTVLVEFVCKAAHPVTWTYTLDDAIETSLSQIPSRLVSEEFR